MENVLIVILIAIGSFCTIELVKIRRLLQVQHEREMRKNGKSPIRMIQ